MNDQGMHAASVFSNGILLDGSGSTVGGISFKRERCVAWDLLSGKRGRKLLSMVDATRQDRSRHTNGITFSACLLCIYFQGTVE